MIKTYEPLLGAPARILIDGQDLEERIMKFANDVKKAHDAAMTVLSKVISNNLQI